MIHQMMKIRLKKSILKDVGGMIQTMTIHHQEGTIFHFSEIRCKDLSEWDSSIFSSIKPKLQRRTVCWFSWISWIPPFLHDVVMKLFCRSKQYNFVITSCKNWGIREILLNQQTILEWRKYGAVFYLLSCNEREFNFISQHFSSYQCLKRFMVVSIKYDEGRWLLRLTILYFR